MRSLACEEGARFCMEITMRSLYIHLALSREDDGRHLAEAPQVPGAFAYGLDAAEAVRRVQAVVLRRVARDLAEGEPGVEVVQFTVHPRSST